MTGQPNDPLEYLREEMEARPFAFAAAMTKIAAHVETEWHDLALASALRLAGNEACRLVAEKPKTTETQEGGDA